MKHKKKMVEEDSSRFANRLTYILDQIPEKKLSSFYQHKETEQSPK